MAARTLILKKCNDNDAQFKTLFSLANLTVDSNQYEVQILAQEGLLGACLTFFCNKRYYKLQTEAAWFITNLVKHSQQVSAFCEDLEILNSVCLGIGVTLETQKDKELVLNALLATQNLIKVPQAGHTLVEMDIIRILDMLSLKINDSEVYNSCE